MNTTRQFEIFSKELIEEARAYAHAEAINPSSSTRIKEYTNKIFNFYLQHMEGKEVDLICALTGVDRGWLCQNLRRAEGVISRYKNMKEKGRL